jgi:hypothetical protein
LHESAALNAVVLANEVCWALSYSVLIGVFPLTYYTTHPLMDYRQPIEPAIIVLAVAGVVPWKRLKLANIND